MGGMRNKLNISVGKSEWKKTVWKTWREDHIRTYVEMGWREWIGFIWLRTGTAVTDYCEQGNELSGSVKGGKYLDCQSDYQLLKKDCVPGN
jgi:hypothetical protein